MTQREYMQFYHLPKQIERARAKLEMLESRARKWGMKECLKPGNQA